MNALKTFAAVLLLAPAIALAQVSAPTPTLPSAGITPGSVLYFLDHLGEVLQEFLTFNPEAKARLQVEFAGERISEIKVLLEGEGIDVAGLNIAESKLLANVAAAAAILQAQAREGNDIGALVKEIRIAFDGRHDLLEHIFEKKEHELEAKKDEIKTQLAAARRAGNTAEVESLTRQLADVEAQLTLLEQEEEEQEEAFEREEERLEEELEDREKAEEAIKEAEKEKREIITEAQEEGVSLPGGAFGRFDSLLAQAKSALAAGDFKQAEHLAKQAEVTLEAVKETIEELEEAEENEDKEDENQIEEES